MLDDLKKGLQETSQKTSVEAKQNQCKDTENSVQSVQNDKIISTDNVYPEKLNQVPEQVGFFRVRTANQCIQDAKGQPIPRNLYNSLIFENEITTLFSDTGVGKTVLAVQIAVKISETDKVLYIDLELSDKQFQKRYSEDYKNEYVFNENLIRINFATQFKIPQGWKYNDYFMESLKQLISSTEAKIVIIDNMTKLISEDTDSARTAKPLMDSLVDLKFEYGLTLILLEHTRKINESRHIKLDDLQGSKMKANFTDAAFAIGRSAKGENIRYLKQLKCRSSEFVFNSEHVVVLELVKENSFLHFKFLEYSSEFEHLKERSEEDRVKKKQEATALKAQGLSNCEIARRLGVSEGAIRKWLK